jgi:putative transposase
MLHQVARTQNRWPLFHTWEEAAQLWALLGRVAPDLVAACLMPDHVHVLGPRDVRLALASALSGYTRRRNCRDATTGGRMERLPPPTVVSGGQKIRRNIRYIHLNPCRARLVTDPLSWPFSTHRDAVGLAARPLRRVHPDPARFHRYVSSDPTVGVAGTDLPLPGEQLGLEDLVAAVSERHRVPLCQLRVRGAARTDLVAAARALELDTRDIAQRTGMKPDSVRRVPPAGTTALEPLLRIAGDQRFPGLASGVRPWRGLA